MNGGNDGLNTVIPYGQRGYRKVRPTIRIDKDRLLGIDDEVGLNPAMVGFKELYDDGKLAIVNSVGYPNPNRSHFESMAIWHSTDLKGTRANGNGWLGQYLDESAPAERIDLDGWYVGACLLYTSPSPRDKRQSRMPSSA